MSKKIIIDCDPGIDDAIALGMALFDPRLDILAITAVAGTVDAEQATNNVASLVNMLDPPRFPRIGKATPGEDASVIDDQLLHGSDGLAEFHFEPSGRQRLQPSEKAIADLVQQYPNEITILCLGPLTNLARLIRWDPQVVPLIDQIVISGGAVERSGNATPVAERNIHFDPQSAETVFASPTTKLLVPLDVTEKVRFGVELLEQLPSPGTHMGSLLRHLVPFAFRAAHQQLGEELIPLYDPTALISVLEPELFTWEAMAGAVETQGNRTRGMTVFDQRLRRNWPMNMEVAREVEIAEVKRAIVRSIRYAGQKS